jgi:hypothetical protein
MSHEIDTTGIIAALRKARAKLDKGFPIDDSAALRASKGRVCLTRDSCIKYTPARAQARRRLSSKLKKLEEETLELANAMRIEAVNGAEAPSKKRGRRKSRGAF